MAKPPVLILTSGGMRSLVTATVVVEAHAKAILLHVLDDRPNWRIRSRYVQRQAQHLQIDRVVEVPLARVKVHRRVQPDQPPVAPPLIRTQILITGLTHALGVGAERMVWPAQANGDFDAAARATEQAVMVGHLAKLEHRSPPQIDTPLLELTDAQLIDLGGQMQVPWELAWSCLVQGDSPCRVCAGCRRRQKAFEVTSLADPTAQPAAAC